jgi:hypothetical protein
MHHFLHINMLTSAKFHNDYFFVSLMVAFIMTPLIGSTYHIKERKPEWELDKWPIRWSYVLALLHPIFLAVLKYRAAHHRKSRKWQTFDNDKDCCNRLRIYLKEIFLCEAKAAFVSDPLFHEIWNSLCFIFALLLFPRPLALACVLSFGHSMFFNMLVRAYQRSFVDNATNLVYNGQRYQCVRKNTHYSCFEDESKNVLYYPTLDIYGLVLLNN